MRKGSVWLLDGIEAIPTQNMAEEKWLELRRSGIGGSDIAAISGISPWRTPLGVYCDKRNLIKSASSNEAMLFGIKMEPVLREWAAEAINENAKAPVGVFSSPYMYRHSQFNYFLANVDGVAVREDIAYAGIELKTVDRSKAKEWDDGVPEYYAAQCQWYMGVTGLPAWYVFALIGKQQRLHIIAADETLIALYQAGARTFWNEHVCAAKMPKPTSEDTDNLLHLFPEASEQIIRDDSFEQSVKQYLALGAEAKAIDTSRDGIKAEIEAKLGESLALLAGKYKVTWSRFDVSRIDGKKLKAEYPDAAAACSVKNRQGRLMVKEVE